MSEKQVSLDYSARKRRNGKCIIYCNGYEVASLITDFGIAEEQSREIVKRCNAYPKLVELLTEYKKHRRALAYITYNKKEFHRIPCELSDKIEALLTELKELE